MGWLSLLLWCVELSLHLCALTVGFLYSCQSDTGIASVHPGLLTSISWLSSVLTFYCPVPNRPWQVWLFGHFTLAFEFL